MHPRKKKSLITLDRALKHLEKAEQQIKSTYVITLHSENSQQSKPCEILKGLLSKIVSLRRNTADSLKELENIWFNKE